MLNQTNKVLIMINRKCAMIGDYDKNSNNKSLIKMMILIIAILLLAISIMTF